MTAGLKIVGDQLTTLTAGEIILHGVRQTDPGPGSTQGADGFFQRWPVLLDVAQFAGAQPFAERFGPILDETGTHQEVREVRTGRSVAAVAQFLLDRTGTFQRSRHTFYRQLSADFFGAQPA